MRYLGKSALCLSALAITLLVGSPLQAEENHRHKHSCVEQAHEKASSHCQMHKEAKGDDAKAGCTDGCCDHHGKEAKADGKACADHAGCDQGNANAKSGDQASCADEGCCKDGGTCCEGEGKACAEHDEAHAR